MKPFRKHVALAVDGGGIKGVIASRAIAVLEEHLQTPAYEIFSLLAGTSTGAIITAGIATGLFGEEIHQLYCDLGPVIFKKTWRSTLWPLTRYRYPLEPLQAALEDQLGSRTMGEFWVEDNPIDLVITAFDLVENKTLFIKPFKESSGEDPWTGENLIPFSLSRSKISTPGTGSVQCWEPSRNPQMISKSTWWRPFFLSWTSGVSRWSWTDPTQWTSPRESLP
jgi:hypothetical protein